MYFAFTSLSTVGLGDYFPRSNLERSLGTVYLLFGVMITSYIIESLNIMLNKIRFANKSYEESDKLSLFFGTLVKFNENKPLPEDFQAKVEKYFEYRWENNKTNAISEKDDYSMLEILPIVVKANLFT